MFPFWALAAWPVKAKRNPALATILTTVRQYDEKLDFVLIASAPTASSSGGAFLNALFRWISRKQRKGLEGLGIAAFSDTNSATLEKHDSAACYAK
jgi:hypothetical protein